MDSLIISKSEYLLLKQKARIADDALIQLHLSLADIRTKNISEF